MTTPVSGDPLISRYTAKNLICPDLELQDDEGRETKESSYFVSANRSKRSVVVDITKREGQDLVVELAKKADVVVENFKVGGLKKYGLDYESLSRVNPKLVYCSITGFGQNGARAKEPGYDFMIQGIDLAR